MLYQMCNDIDRLPVWMRMEKAYCHYSLSSIFCCQLSLSFSSAEDNPIVKGTLTIWKVSESILACKGLRHWHHYLKTATLCLWLLILPSLCGVVKGSRRLGTFRVTMFFRLLMNSHLNISCPVCISFISFKRDFINSFPIFTINPLKHFWILFWQ